ncbi:hypothetical protein ACLX1H_000714 [Fusarium chlamydosporum]
MATNEGRSNIREAIEATVTSFLSAYEDGREQNDPSIINRAVTPECTRQLLPASLCKALGAPESLLIPNDQYEHLYANDLTVGGVYNTVKKDLVVDVEAQRAAVTTTSDFRYLDGEVLTLEFSWTFYLNKDGSKICKVIEFADGDAVKRMAAKAQNLDGGKETGSADAGDAKMKQD